MNNDFKIINHDNFEEYIGAFVKLSNKDIHRKMVEQYEDYYFEHGHYWGYGEIKRHESKPGVLLIDVKPDGVSFETEEFSFDEDLYQEIKQQINECLKELHSSSPDTYVEAVMLENLKALEKAYGHTKKDPYFDDYPYYKHLLMELGIKLNAQYESLSGNSYNSKIDLVALKYNNPADIAQLFVNKSPSIVYGVEAITIVMECAKDYMEKYGLTNVYRHVATIRRIALDKLQEKHNEGLIKGIPKSKNTPENWINFYAEHAFTRSEPKKSTP